MININIFKRKKKTFVIVTIVILVIVLSGIGFAFFGGFEVRGEKYPTSTQGLKIAKPSEVMELTDGDKIDLSIDIIKKEIDGKEIRMFGYNGQIPGPLLKVDQNAQIYINVTNNLDTDTTIHWHGLRLENKFDGNPGVTMDPLAPGDSFEYKLDFVDEGIYWYHSHVREDYQQELGLYGNMLVSPAQDDYYNSVNREIPLVLDDILIEDDCESIGGEKEMTHPHINSELQDKIHLIVIKEFEGIGHLPDDIRQLTSIADQSSSKKSF